MSDTSTRRTPQPARGAARLAPARLLGPLPLLAVVLPIITVVALLLLRPPVPAPARLLPEQVPLLRTTLVCPPGAGGLVGQIDPLLDGEITQRPDNTIRLAAGVVSVLPEADPIILSAEGESAAGLLASRTTPPASCSSPAANTWFTGLGAGAEHRSTLVLVNPDGGPAVADITVYGADGVIDVPRLRGLTVRGGGVERIDLAQTLPTSEGLTLHVEVNRGRLTAVIDDLIDPLGRPVPRRTIVTGQGDPSLRAWLLGGPDVKGRHTLSLTNPGDREARVSVLLVGQGAEFAPIGRSEVRVPAQSTVQVNARRWLARAEGQVLGLRLEATLPVTATLHSLTPGRLTAVTAGERIMKRAGLLLPISPGKAKKDVRALVFSGAVSKGEAAVLTRDQDGQVLAEKTVPLEPGVGVKVRLPRGSVVLDVQLKGTSVLAAVRQSGRAPAALPLTELAMTSDVPQVREALY